MRLPTGQAAERLVQLRGIGPWSAAVVLLRGFGRLDTFPLRDSGVARTAALLSGDPDVDLDAVLEALGPDARHAVLPPTAWAAAQPYPRTRRIEGDYHEDPHRPHLCLSNARKIARSSTTAGCKTYHSFSFADYFDPNNENWGALRVFNDDTVSGGAGFPTHPHRDMEIVTYVLDGKLAHKDSMGNEGVVGSGRRAVYERGHGRSPQRVQRRSR